MSPKADIVNDWLTKGAHDLETARIVLTAGGRVFDTICSHCQQAVEKVLKGFLQWHDVETPRVHELGPLLDLCVLQDADFSEFRPDALSLSIYAVAVRYPGSREPTAGDARRAFDVAERIVQFVVQHLPPEVRP